MTRLTLRIRWIVFMGVTVLSGAAAFMSTVGMAGRTRLETTDGLLQVFDTKRMVTVKGIVLRIL